MSPEETISRLFGTLCGREVKIGDSVPLHEATVSREKIIFGCL